MSSKILESRTLRTDHVRIFRERKRERKREERDRDTERESKAIVKHGLSEWESNTKDTN